jgi:adenylate kinase family enzyme
MTALEAAVGRADTILFLDYSRFLRMFRVFKRYVKYRKKLRSDMPPGWQEKLEIQFIKQIWNFEKNDRLKIMSILNEESQKNIRVFKSPRESKKYLASL